MEKEYGLEFEEEKHLFEIDTDPNNLFQASTDDYVGYIGREFYFLSEYKSRNEEKAATEAFLKFLESYGAQTGWEWIEDKEIAYFVLDQKVRENYFEPQCSELKSFMENLTLNEFLKPNVIAHLRAIVDHQSKDAVSPGFATFVNLDSFIRRADNDTYFIGHVFAVD